MGAFLVSATKPRTRTDPVLVAAEARVAAAVERFAPSFLGKGGSSGSTSTIDQATRDEISQVFQKWWWRPGTLEDYSNPLLQVGYIHELLPGRTGNDLQYCLMAAQGGLTEAFAAPPLVAASSASSSAQATSSGPPSIVERLHLCAIGAGPASELWSLCLFLEQLQQSSLTLSGAVLVDAAPWGKAVKELQQAFVNTTCSAAQQPSYNPFSVPVTFLQEDAFSQSCSSPGSSKVVLSRWLSTEDPTVLNVICMYRLTWDVGAERVRPWLCSLLHALDRDQIRAEVWVADAAATSGIYAEVLGRGGIGTSSGTSSNWSFQVVIEEGRTKYHRNFYIFKRAS